MGKKLFTATTAGTPANLLRSDRAAETATYNTTDGAFVIDEPATDVATYLGNTILYFYPADPVMGLSLYESSHEAADVAIAFDTQFAYKFSGSSWNRTGAQLYTGDNSDYFYATNFNGTSIDKTAIFATNFNYNDALTDSMYYSEDLTTWTTFMPSVVIAPANAVDVFTARILTPFKDKLLAINTFERETTAPGVYVFSNHTNRIRYSTTASALAATSWLEGGQVGYTGGGYIDAPTEESILSVQNLKNRLIVYCERSVYELVDTFNESYPFVFQKLNSDFGTASTFSTIPFDNGILSVGTTSISMCDGVSVTRIDDKIPGYMSMVLKQSLATRRTCGIKDDLNQLVYMSIANQGSTDVNKFPDTILVYNYENGSWAKFDDCITAFGNFEQSIGKTWEESFQTWQEDTSTWNAATSLENFRTVIGGNQHGFVFKIDNSQVLNEAVLQVTNVTTAGDITSVTIYDHNLPADSFVELKDCDLLAGETINKIYSVPDKDTINFKALVFALPPVAYAGGGTASRVSKIDIVSTAWNPYIVKGFGVDLHKIIFAVNKTVSGEITVDFVVGQSNADFIDNSVTTNPPSVVKKTSLGTNILETKPYDLVPMESSQDVLWHAIYFQAQGANVQIRLTWSDEQMVNKDIVSSDFAIKAIILETSKSGSMG